jgi:hypothetical protein
MLGLFLNKMEQCQINEQFKDELFNNIEKTGEDLKKQFEDLLNLSQKRIDSQVNCSKFEAAYAFSVPKKKREETMKQVKEVRGELWKQSLREAKGNPNDAYEVYCRLCSFD